MELNNIYCGDCRQLLSQLSSESVDAIYMDPPFFTQELQKLSGRDGKEYSFEDSWESMEFYVNYIKERLIE